LQDANARPRPGYKRITRNRVPQNKVFHPSSTTLLSEQHLKLRQDLRIILLINENTDEKERLHFSRQSEVRKTERKRRNAKVTVRVKNEYTHSMNKSRVTFKIFEISLNRTHPKPINIKA